jgi:hypothetical protein
MRQLAREIRGDTPAMSLEQHLALMSPPVAESHRGAAGAPKASGRGGTPASPRNAPLGRTSRRRGHPTGVG